MAREHLSLTANMKGCSTIMSIVSFSAKSDDSPKSVTVADDAIIPSSSILNVFACRVWLTTKELRSCILSRPVQSVLKIDCIPIAQFWYEINIVGYA